MEEMARRRGLLTGAMAGMLLVAGCQPVGNVDVNKLLTSSTAIQSMEGSQVLSLELVQDSTDTVTAEQQLFYDLVGMMKLNMKEIKMQDQQNMSAKGTFEYKKGSIPFTMVVTNSQDISVWIEGAKKPIVFRSGYAAMQQADSLVTQALMAQMEQLQKKAVELMPKLVASFVGLAPNPKTISVKDAQVTVHGETLNVKQLHAEVYGSELQELIKGLLTNMVNDEKAMKELIGTLYDLYAPIFLETMKLQGESGEGSPMMQNMVPFLQNRTLTVEFGYTMLKEQLGNMLQDYDTAAATFMESERGAGFKKMLNDQQWLKVDYYADSNQIVRKSNTEFVFTMPEEDKNGLKQIKITSSAENWNVNKPVTMDTIETKGGVVEIAKASGGLNITKLIASLEPSSALYKLLKQDLKLTRKEVNMFTEDSASSYLPASTKPYNDEGTVMVPLRFVSEKLDAEVAWNDSTKQVTISDPLSGKVVVLTIGSNQAVVDGSARSLEKEAVLVEGSTFVPVRFVSENLGAKVEWDQAMQMVKITRE
jgi:hypothetical protein